MFCFLGRFVEIYLLYYNNKNYYLNNFNNYINCSYCLLNLFFFRVGYILGILVVFLLVWGDGEWGYVLVLFFILF